MNCSDEQPHLRLVGGDTDRATSLWARRDAERAIAAENRSAARADLEPTDPRWLVAITTSRHLQGSVLSPERRSLVLNRARQLGVQQFEANMIIALVQEQVRRGGNVGDTQATLGLIDVRKPVRAISTATVLLLALALASVGAIALIRWVIG